MNVVDKMTKPVNLKGLSGAVLVSPWPVRGVFSPVPATFFPDASVAVTDLLILAAHHGILEAVSGSGPASPARVPHRPRPRRTGDPMRNAA